MSIEKRRFGRTGNMSSALLFGGAALWEADQDSADRVLDMLLEYEINHIDTAPAYGESEKRIGPWMKKYRGQFFLATKTRERSYEGAQQQILESLDRLCTDRIDLIQLHAPIHPDEWEQALSAGGALEAAIEAREQGLVRFIGVTGHGWNAAAMHRRSLMRFNFDSVLMPWNYFASLHPTYALDFSETLQICRNGIWRCRPLNPLLGDRGRRVPGKSTVPGISLLKMKRILGSRSAGCFPTRESFSTPWEIWTSCRNYWVRPQIPGKGPPILKCRI